MLYQCLLQMLYQNPQELAANIFLKWEHTGTHNHNSSDRVVVIYKDLEIRIEVTCGLGAREGRE